MLIRMWGIRKSYTMFPGVQNGTHVLKKFDKKLNIHLPYGPAIPILGKQKHTLPPEKRP